VAVPFWGASLSAPVCRGEWAFRQGQAPGPTPGTPRVAAEEGPLAAELPGGDPTHPIQTVAEMGSQHHSVCVHSVARTKCMYGSIPATVCSDSCRAHPW